MELDAERFLCQSPCGISPSTDLQGVVGCQLVRFVYIVHGGIDVVRLACYRTVVESIDVDGWQIGKPWIVIGRNCGDDEHQQCEKRETEHIREGIYGILWI